jgi:hypothetical protein
MLSLGLGLRARKKSTDTATLHVRMAPGPHGAAMTAGWSGF